MAFFIIKFSGLCAFVPDQPFGGPAAPQAMQVLLPNLLRTRILTPPDGALPADAQELERRILPPHYPMLSFDLKFYRQDPKEADFLVVQEAPGAASIGVLMLLQQEVSIRPDGQELQPGGLRLVNDPVPDPLHPTPDEERSLFWLTKMNEVLAVQRHIEPRLNGALAANESAIISRIRFAAGELSTSQRTPRRWQFLPAGTAPQATAGNRVAVELALVIEANTLDLVLSSFGSPGSTTLSFAPSADDPTRNVEIRIQNLEPERLLGIPVDSSQPLPSLDSDFEIYYPLLQGFNPADPRPIPQRIVRSGDDFISAGAKPCSPAGINPGSNS
jgi:hypothetical protein